jgi:hypothetical protein
MSDISTKYIIELDASKVKAGGSDAAAALEKLQDAITKGTGKLATMQAAMRRLKAGGQEGSDAFKRMQSAIENQKKAIGAAQAKYLELGGTIENLGRRKAKLPKPDVAKVDAGSGLARGAAIGTLFAQVLMKIASAAADAAKGVARLAIGIGSFVLSSANARRDEHIMLEGMTKVRNIWGIAAGKADDLQAAIDRVSSSTSASRETIYGYAKELYNANFRGKALNDTLEAMTMVSELQGPERAAQYKAMAAGMNLAGLSATQLAERTRKDLGGLMQKYMLSTTVQVRKLRENLQMIASGIPIGGFLKALNEVLGVFRATEPAGKALQTILQSLFGPVFGKNADDAATSLRRFTKQVMIVALDVAIWFARMRRDIKRNVADVKSFLLGKLGFTIDPTSVDNFNANLRALQVTFEMLGKISQIVLFPMKMLFLGVATSLAVVTAAVYGLGELWRDVFDKGGWLDAGKNMVLGIVEGIKSGAGELWNALKGLAKGAVEAFKRAMGIKSPSRVMMGFGRHTSAGVAVGVNAGRPQVHRAMVRLAPPPAMMRARLGGVARAATGFGAGVRVGGVARAATGFGLRASIGTRPVIAPRGGPSATPRRGDAARGGASSSIRVETINIQTAATDAQGIAREVRQALVREFEGAAIQFGMGEV